MRALKYASDVAEPFLSIQRELSTIFEECEAEGSTTRADNSSCKKCKRDEHVIAIDGVCGFLNSSSGPLTFLQQSGYFAVTYGIITIFGILFVLFIMGSYYY